MCFLHSVRHDGRAYQAGKVEKRENRGSLSLQRLKLWRRGIRALGAGKGSVDALLTLGRNLEVGKPGFRQPPARLDAFQDPGMSAVRCMMDRRGGCAEELQQQDGFRDRNGEESRTNQHQRT